MSVFTNALCLMALSAGLALVAEPAGAQSTLEKIKSGGAVEIGYANEAPFSYKMPDGSVVGIDVEILKHVMTKLGVAEIKTNLTPFGSLIPGLQAKRFDVVAAAMYIKPERCEQVAFTEPMYILGDSVIVPQGNPQKIHSFQDVAANPDFKLGVPIGGTGITDKAKALGVKDSQIVGFNDNPSGMEAITAGRINGFGATAIIAEAQLAAMGQGSGLERAEPFTQPVIGGAIAYGVPSFAVRKDSLDLRDAINSVLVGFIGTPEYIAILEKHGLSAADLPSGETVDKLCK